MDLQTWTYIIVGVTFALYIGIAIWSRAGSTKEFYVAGEISPLANGMATAADWMSAASFISMAGIISFDGYDGAVYLMGWTGGYVLLALLPLSAKIRFTVPDFIGERYYSNTARTVAVICALVVSFTYVAGQMRGVGLVFSKFLKLTLTRSYHRNDNRSVLCHFRRYERDYVYPSSTVLRVNICFHGSCYLYFYQMTGNPVPQLGMGGQVLGSDTYLLDKLNGLSTDLGFSVYTNGTKSMVDVFAITLNGWYCRITARNSFSRLKE
jgi:cation/acetate symporter